MIAERKLEKALDRAESYAEWKDAAMALDQKTGAARWKLIDQSRRYDYITVRVRLDRLRSLRARHDNRGLLFDLNEGIHGNMGGMGTTALYEKARFGTKQLVTDYVDEIVSALDYLASSDVSDISFEEKLDFFRRADHCFGRSAFMMSGSGTLLYFHIGVVKALWEEGLLPQILSGSSGGAFVGAMLSTHTEDELGQFFDAEYLASEIRRDERIFERLARLKPEIMPVDEIRKIVDRLIPDMTFQEAWEHTGRHLNVSIAPAETHQKSRLLNSITSPNVFVREAIMASGAVPGVYPPVTLAAKNDHGERQAYLPTLKWVDGSVSDDLPAKRLARLYGVNHYIVSQTNPHVVPFVTSNNKNKDVLSMVRNASIDTARAWFNVGATTLEKPMSVNATLKRLNNMALSVVNQDYVGDINILPPSRFFNPFRLLGHRSAEEILQLIRTGERAAWPRIEMIRIQTRISRTLDRILADYDGRHVQHVKAALARKAG